MEKPISSLSLSEIMKLSDSEVKVVETADLIREKKIQFISAHAETTKRLNKAKKKLQNNLMDVENMNVNVIVAAECQVLNEEKILEILTTRFKILFPDSKLDIL